MKIISVDCARTTWLFPLSEINPSGRSFTKAFLDLKARYNFRKFPAHTLDFDSESKGLIFNEGEFTNGDGVPIIVKLSIFTDGIVSDTWSSTGDSENFLVDVMKWIKEEHGFSLPPDRKIRKLYLSELTVSMAPEYSQAFSRFRALTDLMSARLEESGRPNEGYVFGGFSLWASDWKQPHAPSAYRFEIKVGSSPGDNRFYASAPLPTEVHAEMLREQEGLLVGGALG